MRPHRLRRLALGGVLAAALGACSPAPPATTTPAAAAPSPDDACALLTDQDIATATGRMPVKHQAYTGAAAATPPHSCQWMVSGTDVLANLDVFGDPNGANFDSLGGGLFRDEKTPPAAVGERSLWRLPGSSTGPQLVFVLHGRTYAVELMQTKGGGFTSADAAAYRERTVPLGSAAAARVQ